MAAQLFVDKGYAGTSMRDIAEHLSFSKAAIYYHFESKEDLLEAILGQITERFDDLLKQAESAHLDTKQLLEGFLDVILGFAPVMMAMMRDPSAAKGHARKPELMARQEQLVRLLAGSRPTKTRMVRARCAIGALQFGAISTLKDGTECHGGDHVTRNLTTMERREIVASAVAALGDQ